MLTYLLTQRPHFKPKLLIFFTIYNLIKSIIIIEYSNHHLENNMIQDLKQH